MMALMTMMMAICVSPDDTHLLLLLLLLLWHAYAGWYADVAWRGGAGT